MSKRNPPCISGRGFRITDNLRLQHLPSLSIPGTGAGAESRLEALGWNKRIIAYLSLALSNDNRFIANGNFNLIGTISDQSLILPAKKIWNTPNDDVSIQLTIPDGRNFTFSQGGLFSDYLDGSTCTASYFTNTNPSNPTLLQGEDLEARGIKDFCLRAHAVPTSSTSVKLWISIYPSSKDEVLEHPLGQNPAWPGILLFSGQVPLFPPSSSLSLSWGQPVLPLIILGGPLEDLPNCPESAEFVSKSASILRSCATPDTCRTGAQLLPRWTELDEEGVSKLISVPPEKIWPTPTSATRPPRQGRPYCLFFFSPLFFFLSLPSLFTFPISLPNDVYAVKSPTSPPPTYGSIEKIMNFFLHLTTPPQLKSE